MKDYLRIRNKIETTPWLMTPEGLHIIMSIFDEHSRGVKISEDELRIRLEYAGERGSGNNQELTVNNGVGILPLYGPIFGKANMMTELSGATSLEIFRKDLAAMLQDPSVKSILLDIDSPGGTSEMVAETGAEILAAREVKPIHAIANSMAGSAAYWLASQAEKIWGPPSSSVGSIGAYTVHTDQSVADAQQGYRYTFTSAGPYKTEGNPHEKLTAEGEAYRQELIDEIYDEFLGVVASGRGITKEQVVEKYGGGRMVPARRALEAGMIDGIAEFDTLVNTLAIPSPQTVSVMFNGKTMPALASFGNDGSLSISLETAEWEHSEPGTGNPPTPAIQPSSDKAITGGWRRGDLPEGYPNEEDEPGAPKASASTNSSIRQGGNVMNEEQLKRFMQLFKVDSEEALIKAIENMHGESTALSAAVGQVAQERAFAEAYPDVYARMQTLEQKDRLSNAEKFVQSIQYFSKPTADGGNFIKTSFGLSALAVDTVQASYLKFASGEGTLEDFTTTVKAITQGGMVEYGERGSSLEADRDEFAVDVTTATGLANARKLFAAKVAEIQESDSLDYQAAIVQAAKKYPQLAEVYRTTSNA